MMAESQIHRPVGRPREFDEDAVLLAAMNAFWRYGYEATSVSMLCRETGLNKASLYRLFGDKHSLFKTALQHYAEKEYKEVMAVAFGSHSALENILAVVYKICNDAGSDKGCLMINSMVELAPHDPEIKTMLQGFGEKRIRALTEMIIAAQQMHEVRADLDPAMLARQLMIALAGSAAMTKGFMENDQIIESLENLIVSWT